MLPWGPHLTITLPLAHTAVALDNYAPRAVCALAISIDPDNDPRPHMQETRIEKPVPTLITHGSNIYIKNKGLEK